MTDDNIYDDEWPVNGMAAVQVKVSMDEKWSKYFANMINGRDL